MKKNKGFSLIEMAIVLIILGFIMGGLMIPLHSQRNQQQISRTLNTLEEVKNALLGFAVINNRLPCPAPSFEDGLETATCDQEGYLPWAELGVGRYDAWSNPFRYRVEEEYTENPLDKDKIFVTGSGLRIRNREGDFFTSSSDSRVTAIIFSFGKNGKADDDNAVLDKIFIYDGYVENKDEPEKAFDDVLTWLSRNTLMNHLITAGNEEDLP